MTWRPDPWIYSTKLLFAQTESDDQLSARSVAGGFRAARALNPRLSAFGQYDFLRDVFAGVDQRHVTEGGLAYLAFLQPLADAGASKFEHIAALNVSLNSILSLKLSHILRYSAEPPVGFDSTDSITAVSLVAKILRPQ